MKRNRSPFPYPHLPSRDHNRSIYNSSVGGYSSSQCTNDDGTIRSKSIHYTKPELGSRNFTRVFYFFIFLSTLYCVQLTFCTKNCEVYLFRIIKYILKNLVKNCRFNIHLFIRAKSSENTINYKIINSNLAVFL